MSSPSSEVECGKCSCAVRVGASGFGVCSTCQSWRCPRCTVFTLQQQGKCEACSAPRPVPSAATPAPAAVAPANRSNGTKGFTPPPMRPAPPGAQPQPQPQLQQQPAVLQGVVVAPPARPAPPPLSPPPPVPHSQYPGTAAAAAAAASPSALYRPHVSPVPAARLPGVALGATAHSPDGSSGIFVPTGAAAANPQQQQQQQATPPPPPWVAEVERIRALCRAANSPYFDPLNAEEMRALEWASIVPQRGMPTLRPKPPAREWCIIPPGGVSAASVRQQSLGTCWFLSSVSALAHSRPDLIENLFPIRAVNPEGVFAVKLWDSGDFVTRILDGCFPCRLGGGGGFFGGGQFTTFKYAACHADERTQSHALWVPLLEKALAKSVGSYAAASAGTTAEAFVTLTGLPTMSFRLGQKQWYEDAAKSPEEEFAYLHSLALGSCVLAASCGGEGAKDAVAEQVGLRNSHAYSILEVTVDGNRRLLRLRDPWGKCDARAEVRAPAPTGGANQQQHQQQLGPGEIWISWENFTRTFSLVTACMTTQYAVRLIGRPALCLPQSNFFPANWKEACVMFYVEQACEVTVMAAQPEIRINIANLENQNASYFDIGVWLLRLPERVPITLSSFLTASGGGGGTAATATAIPVVQTVAGVRLARTAWRSKVLDPGVYVAVPFSFQQCKPAIRNKTLVACVLATRNVMPLPFDAPGSFPPPNLPVAQQQMLQHATDPCAQLLIRTSNRWLLHFIATQRRCEQKHGRNGSPWSTYQYSIGEGRVVMIGSMTSKDTQVDVDTSSNKGVVHPGREATAGNATLVIPPAHAAVVYLAVPTPYGEYTGRPHVIQNGCAWQMAESRRSRPYVAPSPHGQQRQQEPSGAAGFFSSLFGGAKAKQESQQQQATMMPDDPGVGFEDVPPMMRPFRTDAPMLH